MKNKTVKKAPVKKTTPKPEKTIKVSHISLPDMITSELSKLNTAYTEAMNGKLKFSEVKEMFKKLHKDVKNFSKK
jgi:hypothetical protein